MKTVRAISRFRVMTVRRHLLFSANTERYHASPFVLKFFPLTPPSPPRGEDTGEGKLTPIVKVWYGALMRPPRIGITTSLTVQKTPERSYLNTSYVRAIQQAGGVPIPLPPTLSRDALDEIYSLLDGILLTGGGDIDPKRFGEAPHPSLFDVVAERDQIEINLVTRALSEGKPLLAICRGIQVLSVALGGSLYQDIASEPRSSLQHSQSEPSDQPTHKVKVAPQSFLAKVLGQEELEVNSLHHQAVKALGKGLAAVAHAPDQIIEGIELADSSPGRFVLGVQWHPEELVARDGSARRLFSAFVAAGRK